MYSGTIETISTPEIIIPNTNANKICCIDDGMTLAELKETFVRKAGSGILYTDMDHAARVFYEQFNALGKIPELTSHVCCGAAMLFAKRKYENPTQTDADQFAAEYIQKLAQLLGGTYSHISTLARPLSYHPASGLTYSPQGIIPQFHFKKFAGTYGVTRGYDPNLEANVDQIALAFQIATGLHGINREITPKNPFTIHVLGEEDSNTFNPFSLSSMVKVVHTALCIDSCRNNWDRIAVQCYEVSR